MGEKTQKGIDSPKVEVGEIDTSAPFESVRAAVSLFGRGQGANSAEKISVKRPKATPTERILAKEAQLHFAQKELNKYKEQINDAERSKVQVLAELDKTKVTIEDLNCKLKTINEGKESAIRETEAAKDQARRRGGNLDKYSEDVYWNKELDGARQQYATAIIELNASKLELQKMRQGFDESARRKQAAVQEAADAEHLLVANKEKVNEVIKEIAALQESLARLKLAHEQAQREHANILSKKNSQLHGARLELHEMEEKLEQMKKDFDPVAVRNIEEQLDATSLQIVSMQKKMKNAWTSDRDSVKTIVPELESTRIELQKIAEEDSSLRNSVQSLKEELENMKKERTELEEKGVEAEQTSGDLHTMLLKTKEEICAAIAGESSTRALADELTSNIQQQTFDSEKARVEIDPIKKEAENVTKEAETTKTALEEAEKKLESAMTEAEEAKVAEARAADQVRILSEKAEATRASMSESGSGDVSISPDEYEALSRKVEESDALADMKLEATVAQMEAVKVSESEALKRLEAALKEIEETEADTIEALKRADRADAAEQAVEREMKRWRERDQKTAKATINTPQENRSISSSQPELESLTVNTSPNADRDRKVEKSSAFTPRSWLKPLTPKPSKKGDRSSKMEKSSSKKTLVPSLSGMFQRKKSQFDGASPSYLLEEKLL